MLSRREVELLLDAIDTKILRGKRDRAMLELVYGCGLRVSELVGLRAGQVNIAERIVVVRGKGDKERIIPLGDAAIQTLRVYLWRAKRTCANAGHDEARRAALPASLHRHRKLVPPDDEARLLALIAAPDRERAAPQGCSPAHLAALLRDALVGRRRRPALYPGDARPRRHLDSQIYTHLSKSHLREVHRTFHPRALREVE